MPRNGACFLTPAHAFRTPLDYDAEMVEHSLPLPMTARVLVVEDSASLRMLMRGVIEPLASEVEVAADGIEGLARWRAWQPDLVVTDVIMPAMDGLAMSRAIRAEDAEAQIIVVTVSTDIAHLREALDIGVDRYVLKPLDAELLKDAVLKALRDARRARELKLARQVFESASEGMVVTDVEGRILAVNPAFSEISGYRADEVIGQPASLLASGRHDRDFFRQMWESLRGAGRWSGELTNRRKTGELYTGWLSIVAAGDPDARATRFVGLFSDITERKREEDRIRRLAHFDTLTGLPNRILFADRLKRLTGQLDRRGGRMALLYLDLDHFKPVNDEHGHAIGDQVLIEAARRMQACVRDSDSLGRRGGDEFVVLLQADDAPEAAMRVSAKLIEAVSLPYYIDGREIVIGASIGVAIYADDGKDADGLLEAADRALYLAKREGRGRFRFFRDQDQAQARERLSLDDALLRGRAEERFELRFLPEIALADGRVERMEMLLRFQHPELGMLDARRFVAHAERLGLMPELGLGSLREALTALRVGGARIALGMDMSGRQLAALTDPAPILEILREAGYTPDEITLECPEHALTGSPRNLDGLLALNRAGFRCALDDFGAGYCSFALLQQLPLSSLKIDLSFVEEIDHNRQSRELVAALLVFGKRLGLRTVAEGVDSPAQLAFLRENGCDAAQGFLFGAPLRADEIAAYLAEATWKRAL